MREIKFRAWDTKYNKMIEGVCVFTHAMGTSVMVNFEHKQLDYAPGDNWRRDDYGNRYSDNGSVIPMQYTGLHDRNGIEVYEGDLVRIVRWPDDDRLYEIKWVGSGLACYIDDNNWPLLDTDGEVEVVGNIWEHPKLLSKAAA